MSDLDLLPARSVDLAQESWKRTIMRPKDLTAVGPVSRSSSHQHRVVAPCGTQAALLTTALCFTPSR